jgi:hypothetical protein
MITILDHETAPAIAETADAQGLEVRKMPGLLSLEELENIDSFADAWMDQNKQMISELAFGTAVAVRVPVGDFLTARSRHDAIDQFMERFGRNAKAHVFTVGIPLTIGGGFGHSHRERR